MASSLPLGPIKRSLERQVSQPVSQSFSFSGGNITRVSRNQAFAQRKSCHFWPFSFYYHVFGQRRAGKKTCAQPWYAPRVSVVIVLPQFFGDPKGVNYPSLPQSLATFACDGKTLAIAMRFVILLGRITSPPRFGEGDVCDRSDREYDFFGTLRLSLLGSLSIRDGGAAWGGGVSGGMSGRMSGAENFLRTAWSAGK